MTRETCEICRFDSDDYTTDDVIGTLLTLEPWWLEAVRDIDPEVLNTRPVPRCGHRRSTRSTPAASPGP